MLIPPDCQICCYNRCLRMLRMVVDETQHGRNARAQNMEVMPPYMREQKK